MDPVDRAQSYEASLHRAAEIVKAMNSEARQRLVWFVAIAGYALLHGLDYWEQILGISLHGRDVLACSVPWALTAITGVWTHFRFDSLQEASDQFYVVKVAAIQAYLFTGQVMATDDGSSWRSIVLDEDGDLPLNAKRSRQARKSVNRLEKATMVLLMLSFAWTIAGPYVLARFRLLQSAVQ